MNHTCISKARNHSMDPLGGHQVWEVVLIVLVSGPLSLITILGNLLVVISFRVNSQLRTISNYYLLSLAVADLILGTVSMNLYTVYIIMGRWMWGHLACDLWLTLDYVASNASVMNLLVISFDRYFSVTRPLTYRTKRTPKKAAALIGLAWLVSFVLWGPAILFWPRVVGRQPEAESQDCSIPFLKVPPLTYGTAIAAFYLPVTIMIILYWRIYWEIENRAKGLASFIGTVQITSKAIVGLDKQSMYQASLKSSYSCTKERKGKEKHEGMQDGCFPGKQNSLNSTRNKMAAILEKSAHESYKEAYSNKSWNTENEDDGALFSSTEDEHEQNCKERATSSELAVIKLKDLPCKSEEPFAKATKVSPKGPTEQPRSKTFKKSEHEPRAKHRLNMIIREKKAARTLSAILLAFILTWTPYNIMVLASISHCVPEKLWQLGYWLCYVNSTVNPMCYALCNESFRLTFKALLLCRCGDKRKWDTNSWTRTASAKPKKSCNTI